MCSESGLYCCTGLDPAEYKVVGIKSPASFRPNFAPISTTVIQPIELALMRLLAAIEKTM